MMLLRVSLYCLLLVSDQANALQPHPLFALSRSQTPKIVNKVLSGGRVDAYDLVRALPLRQTDLDRASGALEAGDRVVMSEALLTESECAKLRHWAAPRMLSAVTGAASTELDSVDGAPAHQADLPRETLEELLGAEAYRRLIAPATKLMGRPPGDATAFVRKYSPSTRPRLAFHVDGCDASISVNLAVDDYVGADLLLLADRSVLAAPRAVGDAATHDADVAHAVSDITSGVRWSLVVFCHKSKSWRNSARINENGRYHS